MREARDMQWAQSQHPEAAVQKHRAEEGIAEWEMPQLSPLDK